MREPRGSSFCALVDDLLAPARATVPRSVPSHAAVDVDDGLRCCSGDTVAGCAPRAMVARLPRICGGRPDGAVTGMLWRSASESMRYCGDCTATV